MRKVSLSGAPSGQPQQQIAWLHNALREIERASNDNDPMIIAQNFTITGAFTTTRTLNVATATLSDLIAVVATLISDLQKGGSSRTA